MNWKRLLFVFLILLDVSVIIYFAVWGSEGISTPAWIYTGAIALFFAILFTVLGVRVVKNEIISQWLFVLSFIWYIDFVLLFVVWIVKSLGG